MEPGERIGGGVGRNTVVLVIERRCQGDCTQVAEIFTSILLSSDGDPCFGRAS